MASHLEERHVAGDTTVITVGEPGDRFYLVRSGRLQVIGEDGTVRGTIIPGEGFGELALLDRRPRGATIRTLAPSVLWSLDRGHFQRWVQDRYGSRLGSVPRRSSAPSWRRSRSSAASSRRSSTGLRRA